MNNTANQTKQTANKTLATPGFAIELLPHTDLGRAMLILEDEEGHYEPIAAPSTISESKFFAEEDLRSRLRRLENDEDPGLCPYRYKVWARGVDGWQHVAATWSVSELEA